MPSVSIVTGANRGIGQELVRALIGRGHHVIATCRASAGELSSLGAEVVSGVDVTKPDVGDTLADVLGDRKLGLLINNAGVLTRQSLDDMDFDAMRHQYEVNALGPLRVTKALLSSMDAGSKVAIVSSRMGSIGDNTSGSHYGYRMSKAAVNIAGVSLSQDLRPYGVAVAILHPGLVATQMTGHRGIPATEAAAGLLRRIDQVDLESSGTFWHQNGEILPW